MLSRAARYYQEDSAAKRALLVRAGGVIVGVIYLCIFGCLTYLGIKIYFNFVFGIESWVSGEDLPGVDW
jgi:hypothetical protein